MCNANLCRILYECENCEMCVDVCGSLLLYYCVVDVCLDCAIDWAVARTEEGKISWKTFFLFVSLSNKDGR